MIFWISIGKLGIGDAVYGWSVRKQVRYRTNKMQSPLRLLLHRTTNTIQYYENKSKLALQKLIPTAG